MNLIRNNIKKDFTTIPNELINDNQLSDRARFLFCYMAAKPDDWKFYQNKISKDLKLSIDTVRKYLEELINSGWIGRELCRGEAGKFDSFDYTLNSHPCRNFTDTVKNGHGILPTRENSVLTKERLTQKNTLTKKELETPIKIIDQVDETKVILHDTIKPDRKPKAELPKIVVDVVDYLNQKTNQSFKPTTKETIQNINRQVNLDKWEFEDFKAVIDFKTKDWLHDDKMRQYLNPSTLFRQANAEKYLLAAKASKPKPAVQQRLTPLPKEQKPALTNHDIEASNAHLAEVGNVFAKMGVRV